LTVDVRVVGSRDVAVVGAEVVVAALRAAARPEPTLMAALGTSALPVYAELARLGTDAVPELAGVRLVQLDEYLGVGADDPRSLLGWLRRDVCGPLGASDDRVIALPGDAPDPGMACRTYDDAVAAAGGIDVAVLGLGPNGHVGFNEPPSTADAPTRVVSLTAESLASNARYWPGRRVPSAALTAGMATILGARRILLVVTGTHKRSTLRRVLGGPIGPDVPASYIRASPRATLLVDHGAWPDDVAMP
jgi:glucosamine-6-phosphate deaminase